MGHQGPQHFRENLRVTVSFLASGPTGMALWGSPGHSWTMLDPLSGSSKQRSRCSQLTWGGSSHHKHQLGGDRRGEPEGPTPLGAFPPNCLPAVPTVSNPCCPL